MKHETCLFGKFYSRHVMSFILMHTVSTANNSPAQLEKRFSTANLYKKTTSSRF